MKKEKMLNIKIKPKNMALILQILNEKSQSLKTEPSYKIENQPDFLTIKGEIEELVRDIEQQIINPQNFK